MNEKLKIDDQGTFLDEYSAWDEAKNLPYDYKKEGLVQHIMSPAIINAKNPITKYIINVYESSIIFVFKYIDELKNFKNIHWKNR